MSNKINESVASAAEIGQNIKSIRGLKQITQKELSRLLENKGIKCNNTTLCNYERGKRLPSIDIISAIAEVCNCDISDIIGRLPTKGKLTLEDVKSLERTIKFVKGLVMADSSSDKGSNK